MAKKKIYRAVWYPRVPGRALIIPTATPESADEILNALAQYDKFLVDEGIPTRSLYQANVGTIEQKEGADGEWEELDEPETESDSEPASE